MKAIIIENGKVKWHHRIRSSVQFKTMKAKSWIKRNRCEIIYAAAYCASFAVTTVAGFGYYRFLKKVLGL